VGQHRICRVNFLCQVQIKKIYFYTKLALKIKINKKIKRSDLDLFAIPGEVTKLTTQQSDCNIKLKNSFGWCGILVMQTILELFLHQNHVIVAVFFSQ
jgi:hypothetical protein